jgi:CO dehydrogenase maturation factor
MPSTFQRHPTPGVVTVGVDTHADVHVAAVVDGLGRLLGSTAVPATVEGYAELLAWTDGFGHGSFDLSRMRINTAASGSIPYRSGRSKRARSKGAGQVKAAFVGKGGSGKTTLASLFARHVAAAGLPVLAIDADVNQHLGVALGLDEAEAARLPAMGDHVEAIKDYLRGDNPRIRSAAAMVKTTPPGSGSRLLRVAERNPLFELLERQAGGVRLLATGHFQPDDLGVACYHAKTGAVELLLNHLVDGQGEYVVVDMTAGADCFASGLFTRFDRTFGVVEPTRQSVAVWRQYQGYARGFGVNLSAVGNKVDGEEDAAFLREQLGADLLACVGHSGFVRAAEQGRPLELGALEAANRAALERLREAVDATGKDWDGFTRQAVEFHLRNARAWADARTGQDLAAQVDPTFTLGPAALRLVSIP